MLTICFNAVCDKCSNSINVMYMNNYFGKNTMKKSKKAYMQIIQIHF